MNDIERKQIKPQLLKCAKENENKGTFTGYVIVSSVCRAAVERIEELEADIKLLEQRGSDILKELLDKNKRCKELERQIEKLKADLNEAIEDANRWEETETFSVLNRIYNDNFEVITSVSN